MISSNGNPVKRAARTRRSTAMNIALDASTLSLRRDGLLALRDGQGTRVRCLSGSLWITEDHSNRDTVLAAGESFTIRRSGLTLIMALQPATMELSERPRSATARIGTWLSRLWPHRTLSSPA
jgi:hypothetical protein